MHNLARHHQDMDRAIVGGSSEGNGGLFTMEEDCPGRSQGGLKNRTEPLYPVFVFRPSALFYCFHCSYCMSVCYVRFYNKQQQ